MDFDEYGRDCGRFARLLRSEWRHLIYFLTGLSVTGIPIILFIWNPRMFFFTVAGIVFALFVYVIGHMIVTEIFW